MLKINYKNKEYFLDEEKNLVIDLLKKTKLYNDKVIAIITNNNEFFNLNDNIITNKLVIDKIINIDMVESLRFLQNITSYVLAMAINNLFKNVKFASGGSLKEGFFYDFEFNQKINKHHLLEIENEMKNIINNINFVYIKKISKLQAFDIIDKNQNYYKSFYLEAIHIKEIIYLCQTNDFIDFSITPYIHNLKLIKFFKLLSITGAYLNNDSQNKMFTRIYGVVFFNQNDLDDHINKLSENVINDHNKIGKELNFFTTVSYIGQGLPIFLPKGAKVLQILQRFIEDLEYKLGYQLTKTPFLAKKDLYEISGHWQYYKENMIEVNINDEEYALRPMTCPFQFQVFLNKKISYRDLPMRLNETSTLFRKECSGEMHGLIRLRQFTISEGHIICTDKQLKDEFCNCLELCQYILNKLKLDEKVYYRLSLYDNSNFSKYIGEKNQWDNIQNKIQEILDLKKIKYIKKNGEAAFYGPKLDIQITNIYGKEDTLITIQIDFELAKKFNMYYTNNNGKQEFPYIIHRTSIGCYERTLALLIENYKGVFPLWLAPEQIRILLINNNYIKYANEINHYLLKYGFRSFIDNRDKKINSKIKDCYLEKIPYFITIGEKEETNNIISFKKYGNNNSNETTINDFVKILNKELEEN